MVKTCWEVARKSRLSHSCISSRDRAGPVDFFKDFAAAGRRNATARVTITPLYAGHMRAVWAVGRNAQVAGQPVS